MPYPEVAMSGLLTKAIIKGWEGSLQPEHHPTLQSLVLEACSSSSSYSLPYQSKPIDGAGNHTLVFTNRFHRKGVMRVLWKQRQHKLICMMHTIECLALRSLPFWSGFSLHKSTHLDRKEQIMKVVEEGFVMLPYCFTGTRMFSSLRSASEAVKCNCSGWSVESYIHDDS